MSGWSDHKGALISLPFENIDTDQLIPARFMSTPRSEGYGQFLLHDMRRTATGDLIPSFPLNVPNGASVLVAGRNFGTGSSREAAVYALVDAGFRVVIAPSFGDIFASNAVNNGLLPALVSETWIEALLQQSDVDLHVSLAKKMITRGRVEAPFELDDTWRTKLQNGWDDIDLTLQYSSQIKSFRQNRLASQIWAWPHNFPN